MVERYSHSGAYDLVRFAPNSRDKCLLLSALFAGDAKRGETPQRTLHTGRDHGAGKVNGKCVSIAHHINTHRPVSCPEQTVPIHQRDAVATNDIGIEITLLDMGHLNKKSFLMRAILASRAENGKRSQMVFPSVCNGTFNVHTHVA